MMQKIKVAVCTNIGNSRENQEDSVLVVCDGRTLLRNATAKGDPENRDDAFDLSPNRRMLIAVSDGMGGHLGGETASGYTVVCLEKAAQLLAETKQDVPLLLDEIIGTINQNVAGTARSNADCRGMGATLSGLYTDGKDLYYFHAGDSRIYRHAGGVLTQLTKDHTEGQRLMDLGLLNEEEVQQLPHKKSIYKYIGINGTLHADLIHVDEMESDAVLLLCTDGLTDALSDSDIREILEREEPLESKRERLLREALGRRIGFGDNISFILVKF